MFKFVTKIHQRTLQVIITSCIVPCHAVVPSQNVFFLYAPLAIMTLPYLQFYSTQIFVRLPHNLETPKSIIWINCASLYERSYVMWVNLWIYYKTDTHTLYPQNPLFIFLSLVNNNSLTRKTQTYRVWLCVVT